ncbi:TRZ/ATZ family hydrolase [Alkalimarinus sediminis]|uniref:5-methylthioadenosine/S-adenosylhomocysteine deaminase n=1 Tax=Alkalimarinus sediminis TaxID=1632866 RepID=A0A9E8HLW5_9ALTE|nr:TRZ/ATZ family hydrolase [Alkalimarinus sediminis]UZW76705.1 TRZ/ATZ family hydrolase [Alkalimarinus sediminis]
MLNNQSVDTIIHARWVIPVIPHNTVYENHSVVISGHKILDILPKDAALVKYTAKEIFSLDEHHALLPGLINAHGHSAMSLFRGLADDLPLMEWLNNHIWPAEAKWVDEDFVADGTLLAITEMIRSGTTCYSDMYFFPNISAKVAAEHKMRTQICFPVIDFPTAWAQNSDEYIHKGVELFDQYRNSDYVNVAFGPHAPYTVSNDPLKQVATLADQLNAQIQIHLHETAFEVKESIEQYGVTPIKRLAELGLLSPSLQCVHMTQLSDDDITLIAESGAHVIHCPESNLKLASGFAPVDKLLNAGVNVALGTDGAASNNDLDLLGEMKTAALIGKAVAGDASAVSAHQALEMATINGAKSMGLEEKIGSLESGKLADIIAIDLGQIDCQPVYDPASHIVYATNSHQVTHSWIGGDIHMNNRQLVMIDTLHLNARVKQWAQKIKDADSQQASVTA